MQVRLQEWAATPETVTISPGEESDLSVVTIATWERAMPGIKLARKKPIMTNAMSFLAAKVFAKRFYVLVAESCLQDICQ